MNLNMEETMKVAYCVICHKNSKVLNKFIEVLYKDNDIYIHVDKKTNIDEFICYESKVKFIKNRVSVKWGDFSLVQAMINLLYEVGDKEYDYISIVSGDCLPLKNSEEIKRILTTNQGKEFIGIQKDINLFEISNRVKYNYTKYHFKKDKSIMNKVFVKLYDHIFKYLFKNKSYNDLPKLYKGCNWFTVTGDMVRFIIKYLEDNSWYIDAFKKAFCCDEVFFHTIIANSHYKNKIYKLEDDTEDNLMALRYIDWESGPDYPRTLDSNDFKRIKDKDCIIGRKFSEELDFELYERVFNLKK